MESQMEKGKSDDFDPKVHRRFLRFINEARRPEDILHPPLNQYIPDQEREFRGPYAHDPEEHERHEKPLLDRGQAEKILRARDKASPLHGFFNRDQLVEALGAEVLRKYLHWFSMHLGGATYGAWSTAGSIPLAATGGVERGVVHAALLRTGKVLFVEAACGVTQSHTPVWDASNRTAFNVTSPTPPADNLYCSGHAFLSDGKLLVVGGGGDWGDTPNPNMAWLFDPDPATESWSYTRDTGGTRTRMNQNRWYPTVVNLGDQPGRFLIAGGRGSAQMEVYSEASGTFSLVTAFPSDKAFTPTYPGLNLLPGGEVFFTPVGFRNNSESPGDDPTNDQSGYFVFNPGYGSGTWTNIGANDRTKGMQVLLLQPTSPFARVMVIGGGNDTKSRSYQMVNLSSLAPTWVPQVELPRLPSQTQATSRIHPNVVLLPDGAVFVSGGAAVTEPCWLYNPTSQTLGTLAPDTWAEMDELPTARRYHSMALLLPSGEVMSAGWNTNTVDVFKPPYLFRGAQPVITGAPDLVHHGRTFTLTTDVPAVSIDRVVLVRPMAVTHQTDTEQRVIRLMSSIAGPNSISATMPNGWHPHGLAPAGYYMLFVLDTDNVPSVARFIYLH
jgi:hypothetical protein